VKVRLRPDQIRKLTTALRKAGSREIGGQIFGQRLGPLDFRAIELTVQARRGTVMRFVVDLIQSARDALRFFDQTGHRYREFNYLGEWHSHPSFQVQPSSVDLQTMRELVMDPEFRGSFALLIISKLEEGRLRLGGWLFDTRGHERAVDLEIEHEENTTGPHR